MRPPFISEETAADVLRVGKSINFLRRCCDDDSWAEERAPVAAAAAAAGGLGYGNPAALDALVGEAKRRIDRCLRRVLFERYKFGEHCLAVKRYLLLGQGDFHHYLMDLIGPDLAEPASSVSAYKLTGTLEAAIRSSNAQFDSPDVLDRLRVRMMAHVGGDEQVGAGSRFHSTPPHPAPQLYEPRLHSSSFSSVDPLTIHVWPRRHDGTCIHFYFKRWRLLK